MRTKKIQSIKKIKNNWLHLILERYVIIHIFQLKNAKLEHMDMKFLLFLY